MAGLLQENENRKKVKRFLDRSLPYRILRMTLSALSETARDITTGLSSRTGLRAPARRPGMPRSNPVCSRRAARCRTKTNSGLRIPLSASKLAPRPPLLQMQSCGRFENATFMGFGGCVEIKPNFLINCVQTKISPVPGRGLPLRALGSSTRWRERIPFEAVGKMRASKRQDEPPIPSHSPTSSRSRQREEPRTPSALLESSHGSMHGIDLFDPAQGTRPPRSSACRGSRTVPAPTRRGDASGLV